MRLDEFIERLKFIPSFFTLDMSNLQTSKLQTMKVKIEEQEPDKSTETVNNNLVSFLKFSLVKDFGSCETKNSWVLERNPCNIQANVMKAVLYSQMDRISEAEDKFKELKELSKDDYLMAEATAENAYAYSRMGPIYYNTAIELYEDVIQKYPDQYDWKYRMALTIRRCQHSGIFGLLPAIDPVANFHRAKGMFEDVIENSEDRILKALSFNGLAQLHHGYCAEKITFGDMGFQTEEAVKERIFVYLTNANEFSDDDQKVLTVTGRLLRKLGKLELARNVLEKAMTIHPTTICCENLALTIRDIDGGYTPLVIDRLTQAVELSKGLNLFAMEQLGIAHKESGNLEKALDCFKILADGTDYLYQRQGNERASGCYKLLAKDGGISSEEKNRCYNEYNRCRRECIISAVKLHLRDGKGPEIEKVSVRDLFHDSGVHTRYSGSNLDQVKRIVRFQKKSLGFNSDIKLAYGKRDINDAFKNLIHTFLKLKEYNDCMDLATILTLTDIPEIEMIAVEVMMDIVGETADDTIVNSCFERAMTISYNAKEVDSHVRLIYDTTTCKEEADKIDEWLVGVGLKVTKNRDDIFQFQNKKQALLTAMSDCNIVVLCIFKNNNTNLVEDYPIDALPQNQPVVIPLVVNSSYVSPNLRHIPPLKYPDPDDSKGTWLKEFGNRVFKRGAQT
ncbi:uncharacterized protein LOC130010476 [Patella vulgata]|uniref:uncharacterized protein LOC130010476 n=1 Tax=Patella vulgata TaxID=6465 RepID=UPI0024A7B5FB|nr:uncharacterized protein LOC130010476 [Patella vulgata]